MLHACNKVGGNVPVAWMGDLNLPPCFVERFAFEVVELSPEAFMDSAENHARDRVFTVWL